MGSVLFIPNADFSANAVSETTGIVELLLDRNSLLDDTDISCDVRDNTYLAADIGAPKNVDIIKIRLYISSKVSTTKPFMLVKGVIGDSIEDVMKYNISSYDIAKGYKDITLFSPIRLTHDGYIGIRPEPRAETQEWVFRAQKTDQDNNAFAFISPTGVAYSNYTYIPKISYYGRNNEQL